MEKSFNHIEDFLTDESFRSWVKTPTPELDAQWSEWLESNRDKAGLIEQSREIILGLKFEEHQADSKSKKRILERIHLETKPKAKRVHFLESWYKVAAVFLIAVGLGAVTFYMVIDQSSKEAVASGTGMVIKRNPIGVKSQHMLSDGSRIFLNAGSSIEYPKAFGTNTRTVKLEGEAFFEVSHDASRPFKVVTDQIEVEVLGTKFNVNSLLSNSVALVEGKVRLNSKEQTSQLILEPGQMATYKEVTGLFTTSEFDSDYITAWKDGRLEFREASLEEVIDKLHLWYGIEIAVSNKPKSDDWSYTASFKNESLESVMLNMSTLRGFHYKIKNDSLIISF